MGEWEEGSLQSLHSGGALADVYQMDASGEEREGWQVRRYGRQKA